MPYLTNADVASFLNITLTSAGQTTVDAIIAGVAKAAETYCDRTWSETGQQTETFDGFSSAFFPSHTPIASIAAVTIDGSLVDPSEVYLYPYFVKLGYRASRGFGNVSITYTPAEALPGDLKHALVQWTAQIFKASEDGGKAVKSAQVGTVQMDYAVQDGIPAFVQQVLDRYRVIPV